MYAIMREVPRPTPQLPRPRRPPGGAGGPDVGRGTSDVGRKDSFLSFRSRDAEEEDHGPLELLQVGLLRLLDLRRQLLRRLLLLLRQVQPVGVFEDPIQGG